MFLIGLSGRYDSCLSPSIGTLKKNLTQQPTIPARIVKFEHKVKLKLARRTSNKLNVINNNIMKITNLQLTLL